MKNGIQQNQFNLRITAFPRIHITLIGMNSEGYRINGGIGFSITNPKIFTSFRVANKCSIIDNRKNGFSIPEKTRLIAKIENLKVEFGLNRSIECHISGESMTHFGFGTSTATYLSCIEALFILNEKKYDELILKSISSRGGTSGIGLNTYFKGGCIFDAGIPSNPEYQFGPSSIKTERDKLPLVIKHIETPPWHVRILIPKQLKCKSELEEIQFFQETCPIEMRDVQSILYEVIFGSLCSLMENNFNNFCTSINTIQKTKWKLSERELYGKEISKIETELFKFGAKGVGMSSLGPCIFFLSDEILKIKTLFKNEHVDLFLSEMNNKSRIIEYD